MADPLNDARINKAKDAIKALGKEVPQSDLKGKELVAFYEETLKQYLFDAERESAKDPPVKELEKSPEQHEVAKMVEELEDYKKQEAAKTDAMMKMLEDTRKQLDALRQNQQSGSAPISITQDPTFIAAMERIVHGRTNNGNMRPEYIRDEDKSPVPIHFFCTKKIGTLDFRYENGVQVDLPEGYNGIKFTTLFRTPDPVTLKMSYRGVFTTRSIPLAAWLRKHEKFGTEIFDDNNVADAFSRNTDWADARDRHMVVLNQRTDYEVQETANSMGIKHGSTTSPLDLRKKVAEVLANQELDQISKAIEVANKQRDADALILQRHASMSH